jgi:hypothetical protein
MGGTYISRIARDQYESPQALKIRVDDDRLHQPAR